MEPTQDRRTADTQPIRFRKLSAQDVPATANLATEHEPPSAGRSMREEARETAEDRISTPLPLQPPMNGGNGRPARSGSSGAWWAVLGLCLILSIASLAFNVVLITKLLSVRQILLDGVNQAITGLEDLELAGYRYDFHLQQTIPFSGDIPFQQDLVFPFKGTVPINTTVTVPIDAGLLGQFTFDVPIDTSIPVDIQVPVQVSQTIHIETEIPIDMVIPIEISPDDPAIQSLIKGVQDWLTALRDMF